jgi:hemerythrin-like domain-containing protein
MIESKPLKRAPALIQFSKDHHFSLLLAWKIRQGMRLGISAQRIADYINFFFETYLNDHFKEEEELLFTGLDEHDDLRLSAEQDHRDLHAMNEEIKLQPGESLLTKFADRLEQHIRFEERFLFAHLQSSLQEHQLNSILEKMEALHPAQKEDDWKDTFWTRKNGL